MPPASFYARPFPTETAADRHAAVTRVRSTLALLRGEAEMKRPPMPFREILLRLVEAQDWVKQVGGEGSAEMLAALKKLLRMMTLYFGGTSVQDALTRCDRALDEWRP